MSVEINWIAVGLATLSSMLVGSIWYAKGVFGKLWMRLANLNEKELEKKAAKDMPRVMGTALLMSFLMAYVIAHVAALSRAFFDVSPLEAGLTTAFWLWLGISATTLVIHDIFEYRPGRLTLLNVCHQFFMLGAMGLIIGLFGGF
jgi:hypothetical protein